MTLEQLIGQFKAYTEYPNQDTFVISNQECKDILKYLKQVPKSGHWINEILPLPLSDGSKECVKCSKCGLHYDNPSYYCPNCGAKMEEVDL